MEIILDGIFQAIQYLLVAGIIVFIYKTAHNKAKDGKNLSVLWKGFLCCAAIALFTTFTLGNPSCSDYEYSLQGGGCDEYADDGYEPNNKERTANFVYYIILLYTPVVVGALSEEKTT